MTERPQRLRRSQLSVPGSNPHMMEKAIASDADHVFLDLEDAVAPNAKVEARGHIVEALKTQDWGKKTRCVRINNVRTQWAYEEVITLVEEAGEFLDTIMLPKVLAARDVWWLETMLEQIELKIGLKKKIGIELLIEEVEAMMNVDEIAFSSPRLECMVFGMGDYSASQGVSVRAVGDMDPYPGDIWHYARNKMVIAAKSAGVEPIDGPYANFRNPEGYLKEAARAKSLGLLGKWAIHPAQIELANKVFSPTVEEVERARAAGEAYKKAEAEGIGAVQVGGVMIDAVAARMMENTMARAKLIGM